MAAPTGRDTQLDAALLGELHRVVDQIFERRAQADGIADREGRQLVGDLDGSLQPLGCRTAGQRIRGVARQRAQVEEILPDLEPRPLAPGGVDEQGRKARQMLGAGLDGVDPAPLALAEIGCREQIADRKDSGERRPHLMGKGGKRGIDHAGTGLRGRLRHGTLAARPGRHLGHSCLGHTRFGNTRFGSTRSGGARLRRRPFGWPLAAPCARF
ncbi:hypothetical protein ABIF02_006747 [Bradyrhizobium elkanii]